MIEVNGELFDIAELSPGLFYERFKNERAVVGRGSTIVRRPSLLVSSILLPSSLTPELAAERKEIIAISDPDSKINYKATAVTTDAGVIIRQSITVPKRPDALVSFTPPLPSKRSGNAPPSREASYEYIVETLGQNTRREMPEAIGSDIIDYVWKISDRSPVKVIAPVFYNRLTLFAIPEIGAELDRDGERLLGDDLIPIWPNYVIPDDRDLERQFNENAPSKGIQFVSQTLFERITQRYGELYPGTELWRYSEFVAKIPETTAGMTFFIDTPLNAFKSFALPEELMTELERRKY